MIKSNEPGYLSHLDALRGAAALWVLVAHCMIWGGWYWWRVPDPKIAVDVFMVLSGYLMIHQWYARKGGGAAVDAGEVGRFYLRRFFRIAPLYYLVLAATFLLGQRFLHGFAVLQAANPARWAPDTIYNPALYHLDLRNLLWHVTFLFGLSRQWSYSTFLPDWSIGLEMQFYMVFPLLLAAFRRVGPVLTLAACLVVSGMWERTYIIFPEPSFLPIKIHVFLVGMLIAEAVRAFALAPARGALLGLLGVLIAPPQSKIVAGAAVLMFFMGANLSSAHWAQGLRMRRPLARLLGNRLTRFMADTSYSVYLIHGFFISFIGAWLFMQPRFVHLHPKVRVGILCLITMAGSYGVGWVLYNLVERPGIEAGRWIIRRTTRRPAAAAPVPEHPATVP